MLDPSRHQILIVEDDDAVRTTLSMLLRASGYEVSAAANGLEALALMKTGIPAILLTDLHMPKMSGFELLAIARKQFPNLSLIAMSAAYEAADTILGSVVADAFYAKGRGSPAVLLRIISEITSTVRAAENPANLGPSIH